VKSELVHFECTDHQKQLCTQNKKVCQHVKSHTVKTGFRKEGGYKSNEEGRKERKDKTRNPFTP